MLESINQTAIQVPEWLKVQNIDNLIAFELIRTDIPIENVNCTTSFCPRVCRAYSNITLVVQTMLKMEMYAKTNVQIPFKRIFYFPQISTGPQDQLHRGRGPCVKRTYQTSSLDGNVFQNKYWSCTFLSKIPLS